MLYLRSVSPFPLSPACAPSDPFVTCARTLIDAPLVEREPVYDILGIDYAYDLHLTQSFWCFLLCAVVVRHASRSLARLLVASISSSGDKGGGEEEE